MSVSKDKKSGKWMSQLRLKDLNGHTVHKKKRGFPTKRDAVDWEHEFLRSYKGSPNMLFKSLAELYMQDKQKRLKPSTYANRQYILRLKLLPYFGERKVNSITAADVRKWQNILSESISKNGSRFTPTYLRTINGLLSSVFNYAVRYYDLTENPCRKAGSIGSFRADEMQFWTREEFARFISFAKDRPVSYTAFMTLYYTGLRKGELMALTPSDIDFHRSLIRVRKNLIRADGENIMSTPKTRGSMRDVYIPEGLKNCLKSYLDQLDGIGPDDRLFTFSASFLGREINRICALSGVKRIRVHDIRHSHASLLVEMNYSPQLIAERLGHERIQTTMEIYSHLYPNKQAEVARKLNQIITEDSGAAP